MLHTNEHNTALNFDIGGIIEYSKATNNEFIAKEITAGNITKEVFTTNAKTKLLEITDGLSNTIMLGESGARQEGWAKGKKYNDLGTTPTWGTRGAWSSESNNIVCAGTVGPITFSGTTTALAKVTTAAQLTGAITINAWNQGELYSFHTGVCNIAMGDGSVRALRENISMLALQKLAARGDGNPNEPD